jgi:hypothetical protein
MAPKLTPDNLIMPEAFVGSLDRNALDDSIFPLGHHTGELVISAESNSRRYSPAPPLPSPYADERFITDVRISSEVLFSKEITYDAAPDGDGVIDFKHWLSHTETNRHKLESVVEGMRSLISRIGETRTETTKPAGEDVEIITLGTGSAIPNKHRNGIFLLLLC